MSKSTDPQADILPRGKTRVPPPPKPETDPISVNGVEISQQDINAEIQLHPSSSPEQARQSAVRALVVKELLTQEAASLGIVATPEELGEGKRETQADAAIRSLLEKEISTPRADEQSCRRFYDTNRTKFTSATIYEARHILLAAAPTDKAARKAARKLAETLIGQLNENPDLFASLALSHSACPSKDQGGNLGQLSKGSTVPEFETVLFALEEGQTSPAPVPTRFGYHIIRLDRIIRGEQLPYDQVRERIAAWLEASSWSRAVAQYISILAGRAQIKGFDINASDSPLVQ